MDGLKLPHVPETYHAFAVVYYRGTQPIRRGIFSEESPTVLCGERTVCLAKMTSRRGYQEASEALRKLMRWPARICCWNRQSRVGERENWLTREALRYPNRKLSCA